MTPEDIEDMIKEFAPEWDDSDGQMREDIEADLVTHEPIFAAFDYGSYEGSVFVLLREKTTGDLYCVEGGHCSCYGFEGQWGLGKTHLTVLQDQLATWKQWGWGYENRVQELEAFLLTIPTPAI